MRMLTLIVVAFASFISATKAQSDEFNYKAMVEECLKLPNNEMLSCLGYLTELNHQSFLRYTMDEAAKVGQVRGNIHNWATWRRKAASVAAYQVEVVGANLQYHFREAWSKR